MFSFSFSSVQLVYTVSRLPILVVIWGGLARIHPSFYTAASVLKIFKTLRCFAWLTVGDHWGGCTRQRC